MSSNPKAEPTSPPFDASQIPSLLEHIAQLQSELHPSPKKASSSSSKSHRRSFLHPQSTHLRLQLQAIQCILILRAPFVAIQRDIPQHMWTQTMYCVIQELRSRLRRDSSNEELYVQLSQILRESEEVLLHVVRELHNSIQSIRSSDEQDTQALDVHLYLMHKVYTYLGDLARYEVQCISVEKDWSRAISYYENAFAAFSASGSPLNQIGVIAANRNDSLDEMYWYYRALTCEKPPANSRENLSQLFERVRSHLSTLIDEDVKSKTATLVQASSKAHKSKRKDKKKLLSAEIPVTIETGDPLEDLSLHFVRAHGIIFTRISTEKFEKISAKSIRALVSLIKSAHVDPSCDAKLVLSTLLSIEYINRLPASSQQAELIQRSVTRRLALSLLFQTLRKSFENVSYSNSFSMLPAAVFGLQWMVSHLEEQRRLSEEDESLVNSLTLFFRSVARAYSVLEEKVKGRNSMDDRLSEDSICSFIPIFPVSSFPAEDSEVRLWCQIDRTVEDDTVIRSRCARVVHLVNNLSEQYPELKLLIESFRNSSATDSLLSAEKNDCQKPHIARRRKATDQRGVEFNSSVYSTSSSSSDDEADFDNGSNDGSASESGDSECDDEVVFNPSGFARTLLAPAIPSDSMQPNEALPYSPQPNLNDEKKEDESSINSFQNLRLTFDPSSHPPLHPSSLPSSAPFSISLRSNEFSSSFGNPLYPPIGYPMNAPISTVSYHPYFLNPSPFGWETPVSTLPMNSMSSNSFPSSTIGSRPTMDEATVKHIMEDIFND